MRRHAVEPVEMVSSGQPRARLPRAALGAPAQAVLPNSVVSAAHASDREAARRRPGPRRLLAQRRAAGKAVLDAFGLGGRRRAERLRRDGAARAGDAGHDTAHAPDGVCALTLPGSALPPTWAEAVRRAGGGRPAAGW